MKQPDSRPNFASLVIVTGLFSYGAIQTSPLMVGWDVQPLPAALGLVAVLGAGRIVGEILLSSATLIEWFGSRKATGEKGTSGWASYKEIQSELSPQVDGFDMGLFWGLDAKTGKAIFSNIESGGYIVGPSGTGKGHTQVVPMIFLIPHPKIITDFKPELLCITKDGLEQMGQKVIALNPFGKYSDIVGPSDRLNPLDIIVDQLQCAGGLRLVFGLSGGLSMQLYEDPPKDKGDDSYWRGGTRRLIKFMAVTISMMRGYEATLSDIALLLDDSAAFELQLCSILGLDLEGKPDPHGPYAFELSEWAAHHSDDELNSFLIAYHAKASGIFKKMREDIKQFSSFLEGAQQALETFWFW